MGGSQSAGDERYTIEVPNSSSPGSTPIYRHPNSASGLKTELKSGAKTLYHSFLHSSHHYGSCMCVGTRQVKQKSTKDGKVEVKLGEYLWKVYADVRQTSRKIGLGLHRLGLTQRDEEGHSFIGIYAKNSEEWLISDLALMSQSITSVPMYDVQQADTIDMIANQTNMKAIFCTAALSKNLIKIKSEGLIKTIDIVIIFDEKTSELSAQAEQVGLTLYTLKEVASLETKHGKERPPHPESWFTICYTSGTTGKSKGAIITHANMVATISGVLAGGLDLVFSDVYLSYLPLAHMFDRACVHACLSVGAAVGFFSGEIMKLKDDLAALKPTIFISVPRLFCRFHDTIQQTFTSASGAKGALIRKALASKREAYAKDGTVVSGFWDSLVFSKAKQVLGGRVRLMVTGSAPIAGDVLEFLRLVFCVPLLEGYGQTETCAGSILTKTLENRAGIIGGPTPAIEIKLADVPDMNYLHSDKDEQGNPAPRGEICFRGPTVFQGYFKMPDQTAEAIDEDGWLHSGDVGVVLPYKGAVKIIDRKKNFFKLAQGEYVAAEKIEITYSKSFYVSQIFVYGDSLQSYLVAIVVPDEAYTRKHWAHHNGHHEGTHFSEICKDPKFLQFILEDMGKFAKAEKLLGFEVVKKIHLEPVLWTTEDLLTPTQKLMRHQAKIRYQGVLDQLYKEPL
jgi:long-chain acyl-CoA synthetase